MLLSVGRLVSLAAVIATAAVLGFSCPVYAQEHGAGITKGCNQYIRTCDENAACDDSDTCTDDFCNTDLPGALNCTFTIRNLDEYNDSLSITNVFDTISNTGGPTVIPAGSLTIDAIMGNAFCDNGGTTLPCVIGPATGGLVSGRVRFRSNVYMPTNLDPNPLSNQATAIYHDLCDGPGTVGCENEFANVLQSAATHTELVDGCEFTPAGCDDQNPCTTDECVDGQGCVYTPAGCDDRDPCTSDSCDPTTGECVHIPAVPLPAECVEQDICLVIIDEEGVDNDFRSIENAAKLIAGVDPDELINDDQPTENGNPPLRWNELVDLGLVPDAARLALLPTGQVDDEGWYALPPGPNILYKDDSRPPNCGLAGGYDEWIERYVAGTLSQHCLDEVLDVMPLRNQELAELVGRTCTAVVYDSDISMNYEPIFGNLQGARYGLLTFTVVALELPGSLPESSSSTSLYDLWLLIEPPEAGGFPYAVEIHDHEPDAAEIKQAQYLDGVLTVVGESDFNCGDTIMTVSVDGPDAGSDPLIDQFLLEEPMLQCSNGRFTFQLNTGGVNVYGRRISIQTNHGGVYNSTIR